ncbi:D-alanyl-D-alanine carboxypeptidase/D-alanyl-D-alanine-endopeptidase (penicillin-binding protein 4) [Pedobacter africanus]|uniref:D-alanyl-D-alanine carboxypeptidase/D-alanyl-D-alanine-endopeptidase (Penicillin-binding protein 4) n=1 Tax=Pedobacter africanus TaxID=151894 RepID=A0ACC6L3Z5_9SPHI|nr:D-alanyl-D-alanine carboxypeptidase/D-alanyl-D-alanine-endopeptidase [Pedobacter africanus]MDR6786370.1 D-alanyl-D-alanine carboxypeptidase/D-alanyl-D-alanine-endopeptidase (penicillin-binding protein 4) [Pedobacter africanus]
MPKRIFTLLMLLYSSFTFAQTPAQKIERAFSAFQSDPQARYAITALVVLDAGTGKTLFARNENIGLATASTLKTITAATAFSLLGKDFQYQTTLAYTGNITADGTLKGNLVIIGSGDPTLGSERYQNKEITVLSEWAAAIQKAGIKRIEGAVIGDDRIFGTQTTPEGWTWQDIGNYYGAGTSGLAWRENQFDIHLKPGSGINEEVKLLRTIPEMPYLKVVNELKTGASGSGDNAYAFLPPYTTVAYLRGSWGMGIGKSGISAALPDPAYDLAFRLQDTLKRLGITSGQPATTARLMALENRPVPVITQKLSTISSPSLSEMSYWFLKKSINLYGESFLKTIALKSEKAAGTANGAKTEIAFWADKGIDKNALNIIDGSGLSPANRVTAAAMASILFQVQKEPWFNEYYRGFPEYNGMKIKSGTINDVSAFAGYHTDKAGNKYIIVININNYSGSGINRKLFSVLDALK